MKKTEIMAYTAEIAELKSANRKLAEENAKLKRTIDDMELTTVSSLSDAMRYRRQLEEVVTRTAETILPYQEQVESLTKRAEKAERQVHNLLTWMQIKGLKARPAEVENLLEDTTV